MCVLGNATVCCNPAIAETLKESSVLSLLKPFIGCDVAHIVKEALWVTSNIIAIDEYFALQAVKEGILESLERSLNYGESIQKEVRKTKFNDFQKIFKHRLYHGKGGQIMSYCQCGQETQTN